MRKKLEINLQRIKYYKKLISISNFLDKSLKTIDDKLDKKINNKGEKIKNSQKYKNRDIKGNVHNIDNYNYKQSDNQKLLWDYFFRTNKRVLKKKF